MAHTKDVRFAEDRFHAEGSDAPREHLMASREEIAHAVVSVGLDRPVCDIMGTRTEVATPSPQRAIQGIAHRVPGPLVARHRHLWVQYTRRSTHGFRRGTRKFNGRPDERVPNQVNQSLPICVQNPSLPACRAPVSPTDTNSEISSPERRASWASTTKFSCLSVSRRCNWRLEIDTPMDCNRAGSSAHPA